MSSKNIERGVKNSSENAVNYWKEIPVVDGKVNARDIWRMLEVGRDFSEWIKNLIYKYDYEEGVDYATNLLPKNGEFDNQQVSGNFIKNSENLLAKNGEQVWGGHNKVDYIVTLDVAKEICMVANKPKARQIRKYFIACEKALIETTKVVETQADLMRKIAEFQTDPLVKQLYLEKADMLDELDEKNKKIIEDKPKVEYHDKVLDTTNAFPISIIAKDLGMTAHELNNLLHNMGIQYKRGKQWYLYKNYDGKGYTDISTTVIGDFSKHDLVWTERGRKMIVGVVKKYNLMTFGESLIDN